MKRIQIAITVGIAMTASLAASSVADARARPHPTRVCAPRGARTLLANAHAQVFVYRFGAYFCLLSTGSIGYLGHTQEVAGPDCLAGEERCGVVRDESLAGTVVAYAEVRWEPTGMVPETIVVRNLKTGQVLHRVSLAIEIPRQTMVEVPYALQTFVTSDGAVVWVQEDFFARHGGLTAPPAAYDIYAIDGHGFRRLGANLPARPQSMRLTGKRISWTQAGEHESAVLA